MMMNDDRFRWRSNSVHFITLNKSYLLITTSLYLKVPLYSGPTYHLPHKYIWYGRQMIIRAAPAVRACSGEIARTIVSKKKKKRIG